MTRMPTCAMGWHACPCRAPARLVSCCRTAGSQPDKAFSETPPRPAVKMGLPRAYLPPAAHPPPPDIPIELRRGATRPSTTPPLPPPQRLSALALGRSRAVRRVDARAAQVIRIDALWLAPEPLDMRAGTETALARVVSLFGAARPHHAYLFANRRANRMKVLVHDGIGVWLA